ncbi:MAG: hypothetical protein ACREJB_02155, partial [Planctomycetaceae bacterium]
DDISDTEFYAEVFYHPELDLTRIGKPDWCRCPINRALCRGPCCRYERCLHCDERPFLPGAGPLPPYPIEPEPLSSDETLGDGHETDVPPEPAPGPELAPLPSAAQPDFPPSPILRGSGPVR